MIRFIDEHLFCCTNSWSFGCDAVFSDSYELNVFSVSRLFGHRAKSGKPQEGPS
jgi:hypothetical protein